MLYLLYGVDTFRRDERVAEIRTAYRAKHPDALGERIIDVDEADALRNLTEALTQGGGLFEAMSLVVARGFVKSDPDTLVQLLEGSNVTGREDIVVVLVEDKLLKAALDIKKIAQQEEFTTISQAERISWIAKYVKKRGPRQGPKKIKKTAAETLADFGSDLGQIAQELERLMAYAAGEEAISGEHVEALLHTREEETIFPLSDGVGERAPIPALAALARLTAEGDDAIGLLSYTIRESRQLIRAHAALSAELPGDPLELFGAKPFVWRKRTAQARGWSAEDIEALAVRIRDMDRARKTGTDPKTALEYLLLKAQKDSTS